jgi:hypothetical protein
MLIDDAKQFLEEEGFLPKMGSDGSINFKKEGWYFIVTVNEETKYFRIVFPGFFTVSNEKLARAYRLCNDFTRDYKIIKFFVYTDDEAEGGPGHAVWSSVEAYIKKFDDIRDRVTYYLEVMLSSRREYKELFGQDG